MTIGVPGRSIAGNEYGASAAQPIWIDFMKVALAAMPEFLAPANRRMS